MGAGAEDDDEDDCPSPSHDWHFRYNRRLACFSNAVSACVCNQDGTYLVCGTGSGNVKIWDTCTWAEAARLKGFRSQEPLTLTFSPAQRWLVCAYTEALYIFECGGGWRLHHVLPALTNDLTKTVAKWTCVAFAQHQEVNHAAGATGDDTHLAALSATSLRVLDYSGGWKVNMPCRSRSLMQASKPVSMTYTCSGDWLVLGFEAGQMQVWNASSLMLEKTLSAHGDRVTSIVSSPASAGYDPRVVSCSKDQTLRLWLPVVGSWLLEQHSHEPRSGHFGVRSLSFSPDGTWLASVGTELCVWRVRLDRGGVGVSLELHQYLEAVCGSEGLRIAVFSVGGGIVAGSKDGVVGLWMKAEGRPDFLLGRDDENPLVPLGHGATAGSSSWTAAPRAKPMHRLSPQGIRPARPLEQIAGGWSAMASPSAVARALRPGQTHGLASAGRLAVSRPQSRGATPTTPLVPPIPPLPASALAPSLSSPALLGAPGGCGCGPPSGRAGAARDGPVRSDFDAALKRLCSEAATPPPRRHSLARVAIVKRISLEPEPIAG